MGRRRKDGRGLMGEGKNGWLEDWDGGENGIVKAEGKEIASMSWPLQGRFDNTNLSHKKL